ncbi:amidophosphoribosyltransferase [Demequina sp. TTPB684]|uniref:amidophosphoribosyltransferase n=1 Tax=unclassified Demequina TaxID=2620311 RepID=UPI001CF30D6F|nr:MULTISPECIES: amidophosphoribosyltransferase [unclassified Demequina]MCB2411355.1 amidophosphoribosyltransferase [Demequina sp. TTPB684]UPU87620.1 amidophosphoribosyltransferase [Demequina sp. TMPB413]
MARGDGRLNHDLMPGEKGPQDACGVFGVYAPGEEVAKLTYFGLYALQHRGQESAGIAASDGNKILVFKDMGLVSQVFDEGALEALQGHIAVGHARYSTTGASTWANAQPTLGPTAHGTVAVGHNGNLTNPQELIDLLVAREGMAKRLDLKGGKCTDTAIVTALLGSDEFDTLSETALELLPHVKGAFSFVFMDEHALYAARDPHGVRPLVLGSLPSGGWVVASEIPALDIVGAQFVREVEPGEFLTIDADGVHSQRFAKAEPHGCVFEYVYLARPDTSIAGRSIQAARLEMGRTLAREHPVEADLVIPVPESGTPAAVGYAQASGIPFAQGLTKNAYVGRTFIQPSQTLRQLGIRLKLNPLREVIAGKRLIVVDDTIVRGNTQRAIIAMLRDAGVTEVHVRISAPPVQWPCFYGIDFPTREELASVGKTIEELREYIGADSLGHISLEGMVAATQQAEERLCTACFTGQYPMETPVDARHLLMTQVAK